jgi:beta-lactamase class A
MSKERMWEQLNERIGEMIYTFPGIAGCCVKSMTDGNIISVNGDVEFPIASTIKIPILLQLLVLDEKGELDINELIDITPEMIYPGSGIISYLEGPVRLSILDIAILMIIVSDNTSTNLCIDYAGIDKTNDMLRSLGVDNITLRRKMQDTESVVANRENVGTPDDCVLLLEHLYNGRPTQNSADRCLSILRKPKRSILNRFIPTETPLANKPGGMARVRCDAGIVYLSQYPYAVSIQTSFSEIEPEDQENFIIELGSMIHSVMSVLDSSNAYGQGIALLNRVA